MTYETYSHYIYILKEIKSKLKPLTPIVENAYTKGHRVCKGGFSYIENKRDYINNTIIE